MIAPSTLFTPNVRQPREALTPAEAEVAELLLQGLSNKEIASARNKAEATIKHQVSEILRKHGVPSRARLIAMHSAALRETRVAVPA
jgi:DNA-binding NarL/FixJ family response regulator